MTSRYARQMLLPQIGTQGQARLRSARVLLVGAGGLGCPVIQYLAGAGIGRITIVDPDHVEESNLHRQVLYTMADLGRAKAECAASWVARSNPEITASAEVMRLEPANVAVLAEGVDLVIDAADSFAATYILSDHCQKSGQPLISASVLGQSGYCGGFCGGAPSYRAVFPDLPAQAAACSTAGVLGSAVGLMGTLQAQMALACLLGSGESPLGRIVTMDLEKLSFGGFSFLGAAEPDRGQFPFLSAGDIVKTDRVIELRPPSETAALPHPNAWRIAPEALPEALPQGAGRIVLCCRSGLRAWQAAQHLQAQGHCNLALWAVGP